MFPDLASKYHPQLLQEREQLAEKGTFRQKVRYDIIGRAHYAFGLLAAADMARFCGIKHITAIEFGVAEGKGLLNLCKLAEMVSAETSIQFDIVGFDTSEGLPELEGHRDHPEIWSMGDFGGIGQKELEDKLPHNAHMVWGDVRDTLQGFMDKLKHPVGFVSNDLDLYSSTIGSLALFDAPAKKLLPVVVSYFDDTLGSPNRIGSMFRNRWCGQLAAIDEFNESRPLRKIDTIRTLKARRPFDRELWLDQIYAFHCLDHPLREVGAAREPLMMDDHGDTDAMEWPL